MLLVRLLAGLDSFQKTQRAHSAVVPATRRVRVGSWVTSPMIHRVWREGFVDRGVRGRQPPPCYSPVQPPRPPRGRPSSNAAPRPGIGFPATRQGPGQPDELFLPHGLLIGQRLIGGEQGFEPRGGFGKGLFQGSLASAAAFFGPELSQFIREIVHEDLTKPARVPEPAIPCATGGLRTGSFAQLPTNRSWRAGARGT